MPVETMENSAEEFVMETPTVPVRENESAAALQLEDGRRRDALLVELQKQMQQLLARGGGQAGIIRQAYGRTERRRQTLMARKVAELRKLTYKREGRYFGPCAPATLINLNPVPLRLPSPLDAFSIPAAGQGLKRNFSYKGRTFEASYLTINTPFLWGAMTGATTDTSTNSDAPEVEFQYIPPIGLVHQFYEQFCERGSHSLDIGMGGILYFEGEIHELEPLRLERNGGQLWVPQKEITLEGRGDIVYTVQQVSLKTMLEEMLMKQRQYADATISQAHQYSISDSDIVRSQLTNYHRTWHNFALACGYLSAPKTWAVETLQDRPNTQAVYCRHCRTQQKHEDQYFCPACSAPFDAVKAYMAGLAVSREHLEALSEDEMQVVLKEMRRRKANAALFDMAPMAAAAAIEAEPKPEAQGTAAFVDKNGKPLTGAVLLAAQKKAAEGGE